MRFSTIASLILTLAVWPVSAEVYKWKTESGEIQYGQFPPAGAKAERMTSSGLKSVQQPDDEDDAPDANSDAAQPVDAAVQTPEIAAEQQDDAATEPAENPQQIAQRKRNCATASSNLAILQQGGHHRMRLPDGTVTHLTAEETEQRIATAKQQVEEFCE